MLLFVYGLFYFSCYKNKPFFKKLSKFGENVNNIVVLVSTLIGILIGI